MRRFFDLRGMKILVVDDVATNREVLEQMLEGEGYEIAQAPSGEIALKIVHKLEPDLVLLDVMMPPGIDGFEVCRQLQADDATRDVPIIFISARGEAGDIVEGFRCGGSDYITKPFKIEEIRARISTHLTLRRAAQELARQRGRAVN